jgi:hypothetical protein
MPHTQTHGGDLDVIYFLVMPHVINENSRQQESRETNDSVSLFIDMCYIFIGNE